MKVVLYSLRKQEEVQTINGMFDVLKMESDLWKSGLVLLRPHVRWLDDEHFEVIVFIRKKERRKVVEIIEGCRV